MTTDIWTFHAPHNSACKAIKSYPHIFLPNRNRMASVGLCRCHSFRIQRPLTWKIWYTLFQMYLRANNLEELDKRKVAILLHLMGPNCLSIFHSFNENINTVMYKELVEKFNAYFLPKINITMERHNIFLTIAKEPMSRSTIVSQTGKKKKKTLSDNVHSRF